METCINCGDPFEKRNKGFKRKSIDSNPSKIPAVSFRKILENTLNVPITPDKNYYLCNKCASTCIKIYNGKTGTTSAVDELFGKKTKASYLGKRKAVTSTPKGKEPFKSPLFCSPVKKRQNVSTSTTSSANKKKSFVDKAVCALKESKYFACFKHLIRKSKAAKEGFVRCVKFAVNEELKCLKQNDLFLASKVTQDSLEEFDWTHILKDCDNKIPVLSAAIKGSLTTRRTEAKLSFDDSKKIGHLVPAYGFALSNLIHLRIPKYSFLQEVMSIEMYRSGCSQKLFTWFNKLGICRSVSATRHLIDRLCMDFDKQIHTWKTNIQHELGNYSADGQMAHSLIREPLEEDEDHTLSTMSTQLYQDSVSDVSSNSSDALEEDDTLDGIVPLLESSTIHEHDDNVSVVEDIFSVLDPGYSICWDNVQKLSVTRHSSQHQNNMLLWALCFASRNRITFREHDDDNNTINATDISLQVFFRQTIFLKREHPNTFVNIL